MSINPEVQPDMARQPGKEKGASDPTMLTPSSLL
ncbi:hypothetical protein HNP60_003040 [Sphingobium sp. B1D3A]|uniref:Uncharacterized protein n=1 Tax=Sphingobium lignivorans TaxID=2735886 RepID=A0ABR6NIX5_9SPHN|nr:hypothetical protein [Sphingobium lignivorans]